ncbi:NAD(P)-dependent oxidoreductase [Planktotalea sp.]|uniref:NAD(P)-dependent oxidoreductase n=1 Tax=Planktotalea sp. TaxID=2029877 RepID=UPI0032995B3F
MSRQLGLFGLGLIGTSLARRLLDAGHSVVGFDPEQTSLDRLTQLGGAPTDPLGVWEASVVLAAVFDTEQLATLIAQAPENSDAILISTSTCDPERMPALAKEASQKNITLIEAPLSGTSKDLADGKAVFLIAGDPDISNELTWLWSVLGRAHHFVGEIGNGNRAKLAINLVLGLNRAALAEGLVFAKSIGLDPSDFLPLLQDTAAYSNVMPSKGPKMVNRDFAPLGRIVQSAKDFALINAIGAANDQFLPFADTYSKMMQLALEEGHSDLDNAAILLAIEAAKNRV